MEENELIYVSEMTYGLAIFSYSWSKPTINPQYIRTIDLGG